MSLTSTLSQAPASVTLSPAVGEFCEGHGLTPFVGLIADLIRNSFDLAEPQNLSLNCDPESGEEWVEATVTARGTVQQIRDAYRNFTRAWLASMPAAVQEHVRLVLLAE
jgi:hypothetical protein